MSSYDDAFMFFFDNAGWSYDPKTQTEEEGRMETANRLALAEAFAQEAGIEFTWEVDEVYDGATLYCCQCVQFPSACLGGIDVDETDDYARVVKAELALELIPWKAVKAFSHSMALKFA